MARTRRLLGPLFYSSLALSATFLVGLGMWRDWPDLSRTWTLWSLCRQLGDDDPKVRSASADALARFGSEARPWLKGALKSRDPESRILACRVLGKIRMSAEVLPDLLAALGDRDSRVRLAGAQSLRAVWLEVGVLADDQTKVRAIEALCTALKDPSWEVRRQAIWAMSLVDAGREASLTEIEGATHDGDSRVRAAAALVLQEYLPPSPRGIAALREVIGDPGPADDEFAGHNSMKSLAIQALRTTAGEGALLETLMPLLSNPDGRTRLNAIRLLPVPIPPIESLHTALRRALRDGDARARGEAARKLVTAPNRKVDAEIVAALQAAAEIRVENPQQLYLLYDYIYAMRKYAPGSEVRAVPTLIGAIDRVTGFDQIEIVDQLGQIGPGASAAVPKLIELSKRPDARLSAGAELALGKIAPDAITP